VFPKPAGAKHDWEILIELAASLYKNRGGLSAVLAAAGRSFAYGLDPRRQLDLLLRLGPRRLSLEELERAPHGLDLGPLEPRLESVLSTKDGRIDLLPRAFLRDVARLRKRVEQPEPLASDELLLVGRRGLRDFNSWLHNVPDLARGRPRCTLKIHPADANRLAIAAEPAARVSTSVGSLEAPLEGTGEMMTGVVSLPHGWGHDRKGANLSVARKNAGVCVNEIIDDALVDESSGTSILCGVRVKVGPAGA
jgi:anaerobic selenocysteine-containing dehydrogenase